MADLEQVLARADIEAALLAYTTGIDRLDASLIASAFHPGAVLEGYGPKEHRIEAFAPFAVEALAKAYRATQHRLSNTVVTFEGADAASVDTYVVADHHEVTEADEVIMTFAGHYLDRFERRDGKWAITRRSLRRDWTRRDVIAGHMPGVFVDMERG
jgi:hypothetical protein